MLLVRLGGLGGDRRAPELVHERGLRARALAPLAPEPRCEVGPDREPDERVGHAGLDDALGDHVALLGNQGTNGLVSRW